MAAGATEVSIVGLVTLTWGASRFARALDTSFGRVFNRTARRGIVRRSLVGVASVVVLIVAVVVALGLASIASVVTSGLGRSHGRSRSWPPRLAQPTGNRPGRVGWCGGRLSVRAGPSSTVAGDPAAGPRCWRSGGLVHPGVCVRRAKVDRDRCPVRCHRSRVCCARLAVDRGAAAPDRARLGPLSRRRLAGAGAQPGRPISFGAIRTGGRSGPSPTVTDHS